MNTEKGIVVLVFNSNSEGMLEDSDINGHQNTSKEIISV